MKRRWLKLLYESFDRVLTKKEQEKLDRALGESAELRAERDRIMALRSTITSLAETSFEPFFAQRTSARLALSLRRSQVEALEGSLSFLFRRVVFAGALLIIAFAGINLKKSDHFSLESIFAIPKVTLEDALYTSLTFQEEE